VTPLTNYVIYNVAASTTDWTVRLNGLTQYDTSTNTVQFGSSPKLGFGGGNPLLGDIRRGRRL